MGIWADFPYDYFLFIYVIERNTKIYQNIPKLPQIAKWANRNCTKVPKNKSTQIMGNVIKWGYAPSSLILGVCIYICCRICMFIEKRILTYHDFGVSSCCTGTKAGWDRTEAPRHEAATLLPSRGWVRVSQGGPKYKYQSFWGDLNTASVLVDHKYLRPPDTRLPPSSLPEGGSGWPKNTFGFTLG